MSCIHLQSGCLTILAHVRFIQFYDTLPLAAGEENCAIRIIVRKGCIGYTAGKGTGKGGAVMSKTKYRFTYDEVRVIVLALVELKNQLIEEGRYTDPIDELLVKFVD